MLSATGEHPIGTQNNKNVDDSSKTDVKEMRLKRFKRERTPSEADLDQQYEEKMAEVRAKGSPTKSARLQGSAPASPQKEDKLALPVGDFEGPRHYEETFAQAFYGQAWHGTPSTQQRYEATLLKHAEHSPFSLERSKKYLGTELSAQPDRINDIPKVMEDKDWQAPLQFLKYLYTEHKAEIIEIQKQKHKISVLDPLNKNLEVQKALEAQLKALRADLNREKDSLEKNAHRYLPEVKAAEDEIELINAELKLLRKSPASNKAVPASPGGSGAKEVLQMLGANSAAAAGFHTPVKNPHPDQENMSPPSPPEVRLSPGVRKAKLKKSIDDCIKTSKSPQIQQHHQQIDHVKKSIQQQQKAFDEISKNIRNLKTKTTPNSVIGLALLGEHCYLTYSGNAEKTTDTQKLLTKVVADYNTKLGREYIKLIPADSRDYQNVNKLFYRSLKVAGSPNLFTANKNDKAMDSQLQNKCCCERPMFHELTKRLERENLPLIGFVPFRFYPDSPHGLSKEEQEGHFINPPTSHTLPGIVSGDVQITPMKLCPVCIELKSTYLHRLANAAKDRPQIQSGNMDSDLTPPKTKDYASPVRESGRGISRFPDLSKVSFEEDVEMSRPIPVGAM